MPPKRTTNKREKVLGRLISDKRRRTAQLRDDKTSTSRIRHSRANEVFWPAKRIIQESETHYEIEWEPTWEPHDFVSPRLEAEWKGTVAPQTAAQEIYGGELNCKVGTVGKYGSQAASLGAPDNRQGLAVTDSPTAREDFFRTQNTSTASLQPSKLNPGSLSVGPHEDGCGRQTTNLRPSSVVHDCSSISSSSNDVPATLDKLPKRPSEVNQQNSGSINSLHNTNEEVN
jgi:hypothetical protein